MSDTSDYFGSTQPAASTPASSGATPPVSGGELPLTSSGQETPQQAGTDVNGTTIGTGEGTEPLGVAGESSAYEWGYVMNASAVVGADYAGLLGVSANTKITGTQLFNAVAKLNPSQIMALQRTLFAGGFYFNDSGEGQSQELVTGILDQDTMQALGTALLDANNSDGQETFSSAIDTAVEANTGSFEQSSQESPVQEGGNTYQINLTNPEDVLSAALTEFQTAMGRNPTQSELAEIQKNLWGQETQQQQAQISQQENMSQTMYQDKLSARNAQADMTNNTNQLPQGQVQTPGQWAVALLQYIGAPATTSNVAFIMAWIQANGGINGQGQNNALGVQSTQGASGSANGAANYNTSDDGIKAAANLLASPKYMAIMQALDQGIAGQQATQLKGALNTWSGGTVGALSTASQTKAAAQAVGKYATPTTGPALTGATAQAYNTNPQVRTYLNSLAGNGQGANGTTTSAAETRQNSPNVMGPLPSAGTQLTRQNSPNFMGPLPSTAPQQSAQQKAQQAQTQAQMQGGQATQAQGVSSPGDFYQPSNTLTNVNAPTAASAATAEAMQSTQGQNAQGQMIQTQAGVPYLWNQYLNAFNTVAQLVKQGPTI